MVQIKGNWIVTDPNCGQCCNKLNENEYQYVEYREVGDAGSEYYWVYKMYVDLKSYTEQEMLSFTKPYGYKTIDELKENYGDDYRMIIAECIFECGSSWDYHYNKEVNTEDEAVVLVQSIMDDWNKYYSP